MIYPSVLAFIVSLGLIVLFVIKNSADIITFRYLNWMYVVLFFRNNLRSFAGDQSPCYDSIPVSGSKNLL